MSNQTRSTNVPVTVDLTRRSPLRRIWRYIGYDEPNYTYTPNGQTLLAKLAAMSDGPYFVRCHFILCSGDGRPALKWGSTNVYSEDENGEPIYYWAIIDKILDSYVALGLIPFLELGFTPEAMTTAPEGTSYTDPRHGGWRYPPRDYGRWLELVRNLASHCRERYGPVEVSRWYWELWNEPDIFYWTGTVEEYCRLYDYTVAGLHAVLPQARVGGPATTSSASRAESSAFLRAFLRHVTRGTNQLTGDIGTRIDFVSYHAKGGSFARDPDAPKETPTLSGLFANVDAGLNVIGEFPELGKIEVILSECDPDGWAAGTVHDNPNLAYRNTEYYASYVASTVTGLIDRCATTSAADLGAQIDGVLTWAFLFEDRDTFEGFRTLSTNGIDKPVLNVFRLLAQLGNTRLELSINTKNNYYDPSDLDTVDVRPHISGLAAINEAADLQVFLASHHDDWDVSTPTKVTVTLNGVEPGSRYRIYQTMISHHAGNAHTVWNALGRPPRPDRDQQTQLRAAARLQREAIADIAAVDSTVHLSVDMPSHSVCLLSFEINMKKREK